MIGTMFDALKSWWTNMSRREQILIGVAGILTALVLLWLVLSAMIGALNAQAERHREAVSRAARIEAKAALLKQTAGTQANNIAGPLGPWLAESAADTGLTIDRNDARGAAGAAIAIGSARAPALIGWLTAIEAQGVVIDRLALTPGTDGSVAMTAELRRP